MMMVVKVMSHQRRSSLPPELTPVSLPRRSAHQSNSQLLENLNLSSSKVEEAPVVTTLLTPDVEDMTPPHIVETPAEVKLEDVSLAVDEKPEEVANPVVEEVLPEPVVQTVDLSKSKTKRKV